MTTSHELARMLLHVPDCPVVLRIVARHLDDEIRSDPYVSLDVDEALTSRPVKNSDDVILITACAE